VYVDIWSTLWPGYSKLSLILIWLQESSQWRPFAIAHSLINQLQQPRYGRGNFNNAMPMSMTTLIHAIWSQQSGDGIPRKERWCPSDVMREPDGLTVPRVGGMECISPASQASDRGPASRPTASRLKRKYEPRKFFPTGSATWDLAAAGAFIPLCPNPCLWLSATPPRYPLKMYE
jgi:hypothetical protein